MFFLNSQYYLGLEYQSNYDIQLVVISVLIAIVSSISALTLTKSLAYGEQRGFWITIGAVILGGGIWAMHFIGMSAFRLSSGVTYDPWLTGLSILPGSIAAAVALYTVTCRQVTFGQCIGSGIIMAIGIGLMHFIGMAAIRLDGILRYDLGLFIFSLVAAVGLAIAALVIEISLTKSPITSNSIVPSLVGGAVLGCAISSMHYIAMKAAHFMHYHEAGDEPVIVATSPTVLAITVTCIAVLLILCSVIFTYLGTKIAQMRIRIEAILASTSQGFIRMDSNGVITDCNLAMLELSGFEKQSLLGKSFRDLVNTTNNDQIVLGDYQLETELNHIDGNTIPCLVHHNIITDADNSHTLFAFALFSDLRKRIAAEKLLAKSEVKFRTLYSSSSEAVMILDEQGFSDCNPACLALFGCHDLLEFCSKQPSDLSPPLQTNGQESTQYAQQMIAKAFEQGHNRFEWLHWRMDNQKVFPAEVFLSPIKLDDKSVLLATVRDITQRKAYEEKLQQLAEAKSQLLQSEKMATIGQLAAGIAHELNTPIAYVYSNFGALENYANDILEITEACLAGVSDDKQADIHAILARKNYDYLKSDINDLIIESKDGLIRVINIVKDLKDFARVGESEWQLGNVHKGLDSTLNIIWGELKYKCTVVKHYDKNLPQIDCLIAQLNQVFMNLLVNAGQAIEKQGEITITTGICTTDPSAIQIIIEDTGRGISPENLKNVFDPFFTTKPVGQGTGLGLSISWGIIAKHHGNIEVSSTLGLGSTFTIILPINQNEITT
jgi:PAS domain S-box-containing protein